MNDDQKVGVVHKIVQLQTQLVQQKLKKSFTLDLKSTDNWVSPIFFRGTQDRLLQITKENKRLAFHVV